MYGTLENMIDHKDEIKGADGEKIRSNYESAFLCKKMATILRKFDMDIDLSDTLKKEPDMDKLIAFYQELEFKSLLKEIQLEAPEVEAIKPEYEVITDPIRFKEILLPYSSLIFDG